MKELAAVTLWNHINAIRTGRTVHGGAETLAKDAGLCASSTYRILRSWEEAGAVVRVRSGCRRINFAPTMPNHVFRSPIDNDQVRALAARGMKPKEIARNLETTQGVIAGKFYRLGLTKRRKKSTTKEGTYDANSNP